jgi:nucleoside-triphosphatase THEP1
MSPIFVEAVIGALGSPVPVLATIAAKGGDFIARVKATSDVEMVAITMENQDRLADELVRRFQA